MPGPTERLLGSTAALDDDWLVERCRRLASAISAAEAELGATLAEVERRGLHGSWDCSTVERFASWHCQLTPSRAAAIAGLGRALSSRPVIADAVVHGHLPLSKAAPIIAVAESDTEAALVELATHATVSQTRRICAAWRRLPPTESEDSTSAADPPRPRVIVVRDHDGIEVRARFDHINGELVLASIDAAAAQVRSERAAAEPVEQTASPDTAAPTPQFRPASCEDIGRTRLRRDEWRAEGLLRICETSSSARPTRLQRSGFAAQVVVHVPVRTLIDPSMLAGSDAAEGGADILEPSGAAIEREAARWLACDSDLLTVLEADNGDPLHLGRRHHAITPQQRRAVHARFRTCAWPGCTSTTVQVHHRHHRAFGGHDDIENLVAECHHHHALIHRHRITVTVDADGTVHHRRPDGSEIGAAPPSSGSPPVVAGDGLTTLEHRQSEAGIDPSDPLRMPQWRGDPFRLADCVDAIISRQRAALRRTVPS